MTEDVFLLAYADPQQMDDAVYTFEQILHQSLESQGTEDLCKTIQRCQDRVIKVKHTTHRLVMKRCLIRFPFLRNPGLVFWIFLFKREL